MIFRGVLHAVLCVLALATIDIRRGGWLDRFVQYQRERFINDVQEIAPVKINASIIPVPPGYKDSKDWDFDSVTHLLVLIRESEAAAPVHRALRRMMRPSRRLMMSMGDSFKHFPSLSKQVVNEFYYDVGSLEDYEDEDAARPVIPEGVIVVSNPVEARLPSAQISVDLLKDILIQRAIAARQMPTTTASTIPWIPMNKTKTPPGGDDVTEGGEDDDSTTDGDGTDTAGTDAGDGTDNTDAGDAATDKAGDDETTTETDAPA